MKQILMIISLLIAGCMPETPARKIPLDDFFRNPSHADFKISPDGKTLSHLEPYGRRMNIFISPCDHHLEKIRITSVSHRDIPLHFWKGNETILYVMDNGGDENFNLFAADINTKKIRNLTPGRHRVRIIDDLRHQDTPDVIIGINRRDPTVFDAYRLNVRSGELRMIGRNPGDITDWMTDHDGKLRLAIAAVKAKTRLLFRETEEDEFRTSITVDFKDEIDPQFFTFDNKNIYALTNIGRDRLTAVIMNPRDGREKRIIYRHPTKELGRMFFSRKRKVLTMLTAYGWRMEHIFRDRETESIFEKMKKRLGDLDFTISSMDLREDKIIVRAAGDKNPGAHYLFDRRRNTVIKLGEAKPWIKENEMCDMKPVDFRTRDGLLIHGYLTLPRGQGLENLPVVVNPHGGPWARDHWMYNSEIQFLANRGYAVLQVNFRGSIGYGKKFWAAGFKQWGAKMQDDITDGVKWLIDRGIADPARIAIYGGSYGGYATLAGLAFTPELYACGIDYVGVSNIFTLFATIPPYWKPQLAMMKEMIGDPEKDKDMLRRVSPVFHADRIRAPLLVVQGANDPRVKKSESDQIVNAMKQRGVSVEYIVKGNEGHGFRNEENRLEFYHAMERFLKTHMKKKP